MNRIKCFFVQDTGKRDVWDALNESGEKIGENSRPIYRRTDTGEEIFHLRELPAGAMWFAPWMDDLFEPQLEHVLVVKTPGGDWTVDSQASNCTMPAPTRTDEKGRVWHPKKQTDHHCWIIEGEFPNITVSKNGKTCGAGAGSIQCGSYHGFLRNGYLEEC